MVRGLAIASVVLGVVGLPTGGLCIVGSVAGIGLGIAALVRASSPADGRDLAWAGLATNALALLASIPLFILAASLHRAGYFAWEGDELPEPATASWEAPESVIVPPPPPPPPPTPPPPASQVAADAARGATGAPEGDGVQAVRIGGNVREPKRLKSVSPVYPPIAKQARVQGVVILECTISPQGRVSDVRVLRGIPLLDEAAVDAVKQWVYTPTLLDGVPVPVIMTVTVNFQLK
jgi:TonB family protein